MKKELLEKFEEKLSKKPNLVLDSYTLKPGAYIKLSSSSAQKFIVKPQKINDKFENILYDENTVKALNSDELWFKKADYLSIYLDSNKSVFDKKFHNATYLALFFKAENFEYIFQNLDRNFDVFRYFVKFKSKQDKEILEKYKDYINSNERQESINRAESLIRQNLNMVKNFADENDIKKEYIKIFIDETDEIYQKESQIYTELKVFNANSYNKLINGEIYGLSNSNMGMNSKKPFLEHKSRKTILPTMISQKDALKEKELFNWLSYQNRNYIDNFDNLFIVKFNSNGKAIVDDFEQISLVSSSFKPLKIYEFINLNGVIDIKDFDTFKALIDETLYQKALFYNLFGEININNKMLKNLILETRDAVIELFYKNNEDDFYKMLDKYSSEFIKVAYSSNDEYGKANAKKAINFIFSLKYKGEIVDFENISENIKNALASDDITKLDDESYFFLAGQVAMCLMGKSKASKKTYALAEPYLKAKTTTKLKSVIKSEFERFKYEFFINDRRFNKAYLLLQNIDERRINSDFESIMLAGMMSKSLIYNKKGDGDE